MVAQKAALHKASVKWSVNNRLFTSKSFFLKQKDNMMEIFLLFYCTLEDELGLQVLVIFPSYVQSFVTF